MMESKKDTMGFYEKSPNDSISEEGFLFSESFEDEQNQNLQKFYETVRQKTKDENKKALHNYFVVGTITTLCVLIVSVCTSYVFFKLAGTRIYCLIKDISTQADAWQHFYGFWYFVSLIFNTLIGLWYFKKTSAPFNGANILFFALFVLSYNLFILFFYLLGEGLSFLILIVPILSFWLIMNIKMSRKFNLYHRVKKILKPVLQWRK